MMKKPHEFGERKQVQRYASRPGAYALIFNADNRIAVMQTPRGCFLPGGGSEGSETPEEAVVREVREECGFEVELVRRIGEAVEYVHTKGNELGIRKECTFFHATVLGDGGAATEPDHTLLWLTLAEAKERLAHGSQRWAVEKLYHDMTGDAHNQTFRS